MGAVSVEVCCGRVVAGARGIDCYPRYTHMVLALAADSSMAQDDRRRDSRKSRDFPRCRLVFSFSLAIDSKV